MSKNLTRKGLALSAIIALGTSLFAGVPAQAASLSVAPNEGTEYNVLLADTFTLKAYGDFTPAALRWKVTKAAGQAVSYTAFRYASGDVDSTLSDAAAGIDYIVPSSTTTDIGRNTLEINPTETSTTASLTFTVQAYLESGRTAGFDSDDTAAGLQTVKFLKPSEAAATVKLDAASLGNVLSGSVTYAGINMAQTATANTKVEYIEDGVSIGSSGTSVAVSRSTDKLSLEFASTYQALSGKTYGVKAWTVRYVNDTTYLKTDVVYASVATSDASTMTNVVARGANIAKDTSTSYSVRRGTAAFSYYAQFKKSDATYVAAGKPVTITVTELNDTLVAGDVVTVNGKKLTGSSTSAQTAVINTVTAADGKVAIEVTGASASLDDMFTITTKSNDVGDAITFHYANATLAYVKEVNAPIGVATRTIVRLSAISLKYVLIDNFGQKWGTTYTDTTYRVRLAPRSGNTGNASATASANFVGGVAEVTYTDDSTDVGKYQISATVDGRLGDAAWGTTSTGSLTGNPVYTWVNPVASLSVVSKISARYAVKTGNDGTQVSGNTIASTDLGVASEAITRSAVDLAVLDRREDTNSKDGLAVATGEGVHFSGKLTQANGSPAAGASATVSVPGVYLSSEVDGATVVALGSITVNTDADGIYHVYAFSQKAGTFTATITSGSATAVTQKIKFAAVAETDGYALAISAPEYASAGRSVDVTVTLTDKYGAPVQSKTTSGVVRVAVTGAGSYTTIASTTDADGVIQFKLIFGANETGSATITATYDKTDDGTREITKSATVTIGSAPAAAGTAAVSGSTGKFYVSVTNAAAKKVVIKVAGKFVKSFTGTAAKKTVVTKSTKGSKKVTVFVGGKLVATKTVTVK